MFSSQYSALHSKFYFTTLLMNINLAVLDVSFLMYILPKPRQIPTSFFSKFSLQNFVNSLLLDASHFFITGLDDIYLNIQLWNFSTKLASTNFFLYHFGTTNLPLLVRRITIFLRIIKKGKQKKSQNNVIITITYKLRIMQQHKKNRSAN